MPSSSLFAEIQIIFQYPAVCWMLTLWMLANFLKIDYIVVCFLKPVNSACFLWGMVDWVANRLDLRPAAELLGSWPGSNLFVFMHKCGSRTERVKFLLLQFKNTGWNAYFQVSCSATLSYSNLASFSCEVAFTWMYCSFHISLSKAFRP